MDAEVIKAIGTYIVGPICGVLVIWVFLRG